MNSLPLRASSLILLGVFLSAAAFASSFLEKTNNEIVALDLRSGEVLWTQKPEKLGDAHFEVYELGLVAYPHYSGDKKSDAIFLDPNKGTLIQPFKTDSSPYLGKSSFFYPSPEIQLSNGWVLLGFSGYNKPLAFVDPKKQQTVWSITTGKAVYPGGLGCWKDYFFFAFHYSDEGIVYAYQAGKEKPNWTVDLNKIVKGRKTSLTRARIQVIEDTIYVAANEHIFAFEPETGKLRWHRDLSKDLNLPFGGGVLEGGAEGGFYGGGLNLAVFAKSGDILVISFEKRVVALDLKSMRLSRFGGHRGG